MPLLALPTELLSKIFEDVGPAFFKEDIRTLSVSRRWYAVARRNFFRDVTLRAATVRKLLSLHASEPETLAPLLARIQTLHLELAGLDDSVGPKDRERSLDALNADLVALAALLIAQASMLTSLSIRASMWRVPLERYKGHIITPYLTESTVYALLQVVRQLRLDVLVLNLAAYLVKDKASPHLCPVVGSLLPVLRKLHVHMTEMCPEVLVPADADGDADADADTSNDRPPTPKPRLEEAIVHTSTKLGRITNLGQARIGLYASQICEYGNTSLRELRKTLAIKAQLLAAQMETAKKVRILMHVPPSFRLVSVDVLAETQMWLRDSQAWDEDGEKMVNFWSDPFVLRVSDS